jgi:hypothetical protein|tara:strand:+ start:1786 stop:1986 length:201 start_codon:yes stop_codon:yes gene_type:complete
MRIDLGKLKVVLIEQELRGDRYKGDKPELTLKCFRDLEMNDTEYCKRNCRLYEPVCKNYLSVHRRR